MIKKVQHFLLTRNFEKKKVLKKSKKKQKHPLPSSLFWEKKPIQFINSRPEGIQK